jgi:hypothetical protein
MKIESVNITVLKGVIGYLRVLAIFLYLRTRNSLEQVPALRFSADAIFMKIGIVKDTLRLRVFNENFAAILLIFLPICI